MPRLLRRYVLTALAGFAATFGRARPSQADLFGGDIAVLGAILAQSIQTVSTLASMLASIAAQLDALHVMLSSLDPESFDSLSNLLARSELSFGQLAADVQSVGYTLDAVNGQFGSVYPASYGATPASQFESLFARWSTEVLDASKVAVRAQTTLSTLQGNADEAAAILLNSRNADGQVAQMQAAVQMLGLVAAQNNSVIQSLNTTGRVLATAAASAASERRLAIERHRRDMAGYTDRGPPVPPVTQLP